VLNTRIDVDDGDSSCQGGSDGVLRVVTTVSLVLPTGIALSICHFPPVKIRQDASGLRC